jgi:hypothetical protein
MRLWLLAAALLANPAAAQLRTIPADARLGEIRHVQEMLVELDGKPQRLAPGAQIRDADNRLMLPVSLSDKQSVKYLLDAQGLVHRVWLLTAEERARAEQEAPPKPGPTPVK